LLFKKDIEEVNKLSIFDIICNLTQSTFYRQKLATEGYFAKLFASVPDGDEKTLVKYSWLCALICYHQDMLALIEQLKLQHFVIKLTDKNYNPIIRSNAVLAISLLTYHPKMFDELLQLGVLDLALGLSMDPKCDLIIKANSTLALVHFALSKKSIKLLIDRRVMDIFAGINNIDNGEIQTNVAWIFLALCNSGITGKQMLEGGITRDIFLVSCNPEFSQIRYVVIAGFAELGRTEGI
jgi:hypothetical protein